MITVTATSLGAHQFLYGMPGDLLETLAKTASITEFPARYRIFDVGGPATRFWLIRSGYVALNMQVPGEGRIVVDTIGMGEVLGWSWLFPPYQWVFGAVAVEPVETFEFDGAAVRSCCAADPRLGYELTRRLVEVVAGRLKATRIRLLTQYGPTGDR